MFLVTYGPTMLMQFVNCTWPTLTLCFFLTFWTWLAIPFFIIKHLLPKEVLKKSPWFFQLHIYDHHKKYLAPKVKMCLVLSHLLAIVLNTLQSIPFCYIMKLSSFSEPKSITLYLLFSKLGSLHWSFIHLTSKTILKT